MGDNKAPSTLSDKTQVLKDNRLADVDTQFSHLEPYYSSRLHEVLKVQAAVRRKLVKSHYQIIGIFLFI